jgi:flagellar motor switch protein FliM
MESATISGAKLLGTGFHPSMEYRLKRYDFKRPDKFSKDQIRTISILHETFARLSSATLSSTLRILAHVHEASVDQCTYEEFIRSVPNPTVLGVLPLPPLRGAAVLEIDPALSFAMIDRLLGGRGDPRDMKREITDMECKLITGMIERLLGGLREAWRIIRPLEPKLAAIETNPMFCQIAPPSEMVVLVSLATRIGEAEGFMNLCIPNLTLEPMIPQLSARAVFSAHNPQSAETVRAAAAALPVDAEVSHDGEALSLAALMKLRRGSLVHLPGYGKGTAFLHVGGERLFRLERKPGGAPNAWSAVQDALPTGLELATPVAKAAVGESGSLADRMEAAFKSVEDRMSEITRGQQKLADQLLFESPEKAGPGNEGRRLRPFAGLSMSNCEELAAFLGEEHPQAVALVLSFLEPGLAACILGKIPQEAQTDIAERICALGKIAPQVLAEVEASVMGKLKAVAEAEPLQTGGVETMVEILNVGARGLEKHVVESMEKSNPLMAEEIKKRMFVFEDITLLDRKAVTLVLEEAPEEDLLLSLKAVPENVRLFIWECVPRARVEALRARLEQMGSVRLTDVDAAQQRIVGIIRRMEEEGKIIVAREGEVIG